MTTKRLVYHGTCARRLDSIREHGLLAESGHCTVENGNYPGVYFWRKREDAIGFAVAHWSTPAVVTVEFAGAFTDLLEDDYEMEDSDGEPALRYPYDVRPDAIRELTKLCD